MEFKDPWILILIPAVLFTLFFLKKKKEIPGIRFSNGELLTGLKDSFRIKIFKNVFLLRVLSSTLIIFALAGPQSVLKESKILSEGIDIVLTVDVSTSMLAEDFSTDTKRKGRIEAAKDVIKNFVGGRSNDRVGMVIFASRAYTVCPLTLDHEWFLQNLERVEAGMLEDGTALGYGIISALSGLKNAKTKEKVIILLTDGRNNAGDISPLTAAEAAKALKVKVYTIGVGSKKTVFYPVQDPFGNKIYKPVNAEVDEKTLKLIASRTGARFFRATDIGTLQEIYNEIDKLEKSMIEEKAYYKYGEMFHLFLIPGMVLLFLEFIIKNIILKVLP